MCHIRGDLRAASPSPTADRLTVTPLTTAGYQMARQRYASLNRHKHTTQPYTETTATSAAGQLDTATMQATHHCIVK